MAQTITRPTLSYDQGVGRRVALSRNDPLLGEVGAIVGRYRIDAADIWDDRLRNTDAALSERISHRFRSFDMLRRYPDDITVRANVLSGNESELDKILDGEGSVMVYGFRSMDGDSLAAWVLIDLRELANWYQAFVEEHREAPGHLQFNLDGTPFRVFNLASLPPSCVVARQKYQGAL